MPTAAAPPKTRFLELDNGLPLLVHENRSAPVVCADLWVRTGAADETPELNGVSHFLEHMVFKGTAKRGPGEIEREIERRGGVCNAATGHEYTHYYIAAPSEGLPLLLELLAEMTLEPALDPEELERERLVILEEWRRKRDNPAGSLFEDLYERAYESGPCRRPVLGTEDTIRSISREAMADYHARHYAPANMALVLAGDVDPAEAAQLAGGFFGRIARSFRPLLEAPEPVRPAAGGALHRERPTGGEIYWALARSKPGALREEEMLALDLAGCVLGQGRASRLYGEVKERRGLASAIGCHMGRHRADGLFMVTATAKPEDREGLGRAVREELARLANDGPAPEEMNRARRLLASGHAFAGETAAGAASRIGHLHTLTGRPGFYDELPERLAAVPAKAVHEAFAAVFEEAALVEVSTGPAAPPARPPAGLETAPIAR